MDLKIEMIPNSAWNCNLRKMLKQSQWDLIRKTAYSEQNHLCAICGSKPNVLEAHEVWEFDANDKVQKLVNVVALCQPCHGVIHYGRSLMIGYGDEAYSHYRKVTGRNKRQFEKEFKQAYDKYLELSKIEKWTLDLIYVQRFGIDIDISQIKKAPTE